MSTHALIAKQESSGKIRSIYCHAAGYIEGVGKRLFEHFQDAEKIDALLDGGEISQLGSRIDAPEGHSFDKRINDCTVFYARDRGEKDVESTEYEDIGEFMKEPFSHKYLYTDGLWFICDGTDDGNIWRPLKESDFDAI